jgi:ABC-type multidrug transport system fused ATPase/permease subunit
LVRINLDSKMYNSCVSQPNIKTLKSCFELLNSADRKKLTVIALIQIFLGVFDLIGIAIIGVLGALSISGVQSSAPGDRVSQILDLLHLEGYSLQVQAAFLGSFAAVILVAKTLLSIYFTKKILNYLSKKSAEVSNTMVNKILSNHFQSHEIGTVAQTVFAVSNGVDVILLKIVATVLNIVSDASLLVILGVGLLIVDPTTAAASVVLFLTTGYILYKFMHVRAQELGAESSSLEIRTNETLMEILTTYRDIHVRDRRSYYSNLYSGTRLQLASTNVSINFQPLLSKYVIEAVIVFGALSVAGIQFIMNDAIRAIGALAIFLAAGTRMGPAFIRLQQSAVQIRGSLGSAWPTLRLIQQLRQANIVSLVDSVLDTKHLGFQGDLGLKGVSFQYSGAADVAINNLELEVPQGTFVAVVGPSGSGKSTLADLILGVLKPSSGCIEISSCSPGEAIGKWPGALGYVPQNVPILKGSIFSNVSLGFGDSEVNRELARDALNAAQLESFINSQELGIDTVITEGGLNLSGGQRQRIGIARALFTKPKLLILDEATSSLDGITENEISRSISALKGNITLVVIAHRLSTIRNADLVIYLEKGEVISRGTFEEVRSSVPDFESQASLMGL